MRPLLSVSLYPSTHCSTRSRRRRPVVLVSGRPYYSRGNVSWNPAAPKIGYCTHDDVLFPTWHRPYLALYEQVLAGHVQTIAAAYNDTTYTTATSNFRIPYWDWAAVPELPPVVSDTTVQINTPNGTQSVANPLLLYKFQQFPLNATWFPTKGTSMADEDLAEDPTTLRFPNTAILGISQPNMVNEDLGADDLTSMIYSMFAKAKTFYNAATQVSPGPSRKSSRRCVGHMSQLSFSAFDPMFWLHHANVDRLFAMWQAIYPDVWMLPQSDLIGTFTIAPGTSDTSVSSLTPFYQADGKTPWTSDAARSTNAVIKNATELSANVTATVNSLYNPGGVFTGSKEKRDEKMEWSVAVQALSTSLGERFTVRLYTESRSPVASFYVLPPPVAGGTTPELTYHNEFTLKSALKTIDTTKIEDVVDYLKANLSWSIEKGCGTVVTTEQASGLVITVQDEIVIYPADKTGLPVYGTKTIHPEITSGKACGASS
ncbi:hypothetical protein NHQ30_010245 [Ciborinia camelliae]|nr:hypothetical protein NHQ30_010245 [Ciborinia camelliae]